MNQHARWTPNLADATKESTYYALTMFPYPSGVGLHTGHASVFTINDVIARYQRHCGKTVLNPFGFDSFGLPTENYAMQQGKPAYEVTQENIKHFIKQVEALQLSFDMQRIVATSDPSYYEWTQRLFLKLFKAGLAYRDELRVNRCPNCQTVLANDQVVDGKCERCKAEINQKKMPQWFIKITDYAERLIDDLELIDWPEETKIGQKNWIGKSVGAEIDFTVGGETVTVFTTRPDTIYGVTALVLAPENTLLDEQLADKRDAVLAYRKETLGRTAVERQQHTKDKSGIFSGLYALHPLSGEQIPVWYADYVLPDYATGSVMFVPAHDQRDNEFAQKYNIPVIEVISGEKDASSGLVYSGVMQHSGPFDGLPSDQAKEKIIDYIVEQGYGRKKTTYKLRDRSVSRQRYRGSPIPVYYDEDGKPQPIPESELPVLLPLDVKNYKPKGKSPLADHPTFPNYTAPDGQTYSRECDTLDTFMCSSFYFLRYPDVGNNDALISKELADKMFPIDCYSGGKEHTVGHLLYARFIHKFLFDQGYVSSPEPIKKLIHQGMILGPDGRKMSKRRGNTIDPLDVIEQYGSDAVRTYLMFMGPVEQDKVWNENALRGMKKFLDKVSGLVPPMGVSFWIGDNYLAMSNEQQDIAKGEVLSLYHETIDTLKSDIEAHKLNTAVSKIMILINKIIEQGVAPKEVLEGVAVFLSPFAPTVAESMRAQLGNSTDIAFVLRPVADPSKIVQTSINLPVQVNGKMRGNIDIAPGLDQKHIESLAQQIENVVKYIGDNPIKKVIYVQDKIINFIV